MIQYDSYVTYVLNYVFYFKGTTVIQPPPTAVTNDAQKSASSNEPVTEANVTNNDKHVTEVLSPSSPAVAPPTKPKPV